MTNKLEIWPQRQMYFAAAITIHHSEGGGISMGGGGLTLVLTWLMAGRGVASRGGGGVS